MGGGGGLYWKYAELESLERCGGERERERGNNVKKRPDTEHYFFECQQPSLYLLQFSRHKENNYNWLLAFSLSSLKCMHLPVDRMPTVQKFILPIRPFLYVGEKERTLSPSRLKAKVCPLRS